MTAAGDAQAQQAGGHVLGDESLLPSDEAIETQGDKINRLRHTYGPEGHNGWLSTLVWNIRNRYLTWPDSTIEAKSVQLIVEGFLAEIDEIDEALRWAFGGRDHLDIVHEWQTEMQRRERAAARTTP